MPGSPETAAWRKPSGPASWRALVRRSSSSSRPTNSMPVGRAEPELLRFRSFGKTSLHEVQRKLVEIGLSLGMKTDQGVPSDGSAPEPEETSETSDVPTSDTTSDPSIPAGTGPMESFTMGE